MIDALTPADIATRLAAPPAERAAFLRGAAEAGVAEAQLVYGQMLLDGHGVPVDAIAALGWFTRAAAQHHVLAINMVGRCYDLGWGTTPDKGRAAECYRIVAEQGLGWGMYNYATLLTLGEGVTEDKATALGWFRQAAATGPSLLAAKATNFIGSFHEDGWVVPRNVSKAARLYARAAAGGDFRGCFNHARMLGESGQADAAIGWLKRAGETATPAFIEKAATWLAASPVPAFRVRGVQALRAASC